MPIIKIIMRCCSYNFGLIVLMMFGNFSKLNSPGQLIQFWQNFQTSFVLLNINPKLYSQSHDYLYLLSKQMHIHISLEFSTLHFAVLGWNTTFNTHKITLALVSYLGSLVARAWHQHLKGLVSIPAGGPTVDVFLFSENTFTL